MHSSRLFTTSFADPATDTNIAEELYRSPRWYACRTRARAEKKVNQRLKGAGFESYLPLVERERQWADRTKRVPFPLFPGYIFARFDLTRMHDILTTPGVATIVRLDGCPTPVREDVVRSVRIMVEGANRTGVLPSASPGLQPGQPVVVTEGPFAGMRGELVEKRGRSRVAVRLWAIRQAVSVELDSSVLRPAA